LGELTVDEPLSETSTTNERVGASGAFFSDFQGVHGISPRQEE